MPFWLRRPWRTRSTWHVVVPYDKFGLEFGGIWCFSGRIPILPPSSPGSLRSFGGRLIAGSLAFGTRSRSGRRCLRRALASLLFGDSRVDGSLESLRAAVSTPRKHVCSINLPGTLFYSEQGFLASLPCLLSLPTADSSVLLKSETWIVQLLGKYEPMRSKVRTAPSNLARQRAEKTAECWSIVIYL